MDNLKGSIMSSSHVIISDDYFFAIALNSLFLSKPLRGNYLIIDVESTSRLQVKQCLSQNVKVFAFISNDFDYYALRHLENVVFIDRQSEMSEVLSCLSRSHALFNYRLKTKLTQREVNVLSCLQQGLDTHEIGERLGVGIKAVYASRSRLVYKMRAGNRIYLYRNIMRP
jgi:DNA-binding NarL/FixJ family response regulator